MFGGGGGSHLGALGVMSDFHARNVSSRTPATLPKPQVTAATIPMINGDSPSIISMIAEGLSSKFIVASLNLERAISMPSRLKQATTVMAHRW